MASIFGEKVHSRNALLPGSPAMLAPPSSFIPIPIQVPIQVPTHPINPIHPIHPIYCVCEVYIYTSDLPAHLVGVCWLDELYMFMSDEEILFMP